MAKHNLYKQAPVYAPNAVPSPAGWRDHRTNELLVAIRLNMSDFDGTVANVVEEVAVVEQPEVTQEAVTEPEVAQEAVTEPEVAVEQTEEAVTEPEVAQEAVTEQTEEVAETEVTEAAKQTKTKNSKK
jgi:hypothetical protein